MASEPSNIQENTENSVEFGESINADSAPNAAIACEFYYNLFLSGVSCDIVLESGVDQKRIPTHRCILRKSSDFFKALLTHSTQERTVIVIENVAGDLLHSFVAYCYTNAIDINENNVDRMLAAASLLQFQTVEKKCIEQLMFGMNETNCLGIWLLADQYQHILDRDIAFEMALELFRIVSHEEEFVNLNVEPLEMLLGHDDLNVYSEEDVFEALQRWIIYDAEARKPVFERLFTVVRVDHLKEAFLIDMAPWFNDFGFGNVYAKTMEHYSMAGQLVQRRRFTEHPTMYAANRTGVSDEMDIIQYDSNKREWFIVQTVPGARIGHQVVLIDNRFLFVIGGYTMAYDVVNSVLRIDLQTMEVANMCSIDGVHHLLMESAVHLNGKIYVLCQDDMPMWMNPNHHHHHFHHNPDDHLYDENEHMADDLAIEKTEYRWLIYDIQLDEWTKTEPFLNETHSNGKYFRYTHTIKPFAYNDLILAFGGCWTRKSKPLPSRAVNEDIGHAVDDRRNDNEDDSDDDDYYDSDHDRPCRSIASFDFRVNKWVPWNELICGKMRVVPFLSASGELFAGGHNHQLVDQTETITFERYDAEKERWSLMSIVSEKIPRFHSIKLYNNSLYIYGFGKPHLGRKRNSQANDGSELICAGNKYEFGTLDMETGQWSLWPSCDNKKNIFTHIGSQIAYRLPY